MCGASMVHPLINIFFSFNLFMFIEFLSDLMEYFLFISWCQIYLCKFLEFLGSSFHG
jgi:hypothetical protein